jgi:hypothetical protein
MKSITILRIAFLSFFFAGLTFVSSDSQLQAQLNSGQDVYAPPTETFVSSEVAQVRLDQAISPIKSFIETLNPGSSQYNQAYSKYLVFNGTLNAIANGEKVKDAIIQGLKSVASDEYEMGKMTLYNYRLELINLLKV